MANYQATLTSREKSTVKFNLTVDPETFAAALQTAYEKEGRKYNVPGFRKGKRAPRKLIESYYGAEVFFDGALEAAWGDAYEYAVKTLELKPVGRPEIDVKKIGLEEGLEFEVSVEVEPEFELGQYKDMELSYRAVEASAEKVEQDLEAERQSNARFVPVERPIELGDRVILDYSGSVDGVKFDGGTADNQTLDIGSHTFIPGFEEQMIGMSAGESGDLNVIFPEEYHSEELAGKAAVFAVTVHEVQAKELPEVDDAFIQDISEYDTLEEYKAAKLKELEETAEKTNRSARRGAAVEAACNNTEIDIPKAMIERQAEYMVEELASRIRNAGISMEDYFKYMGTDKDALVQQYMEPASMQVKSRLVIEAIGKAENITCSDEELKELFGEYLKEAGDGKVEDYFAKLSEEDKDYFRSEKIYDKTLEYLETCNTYVVKAEEPAEEQEAEAPAEEA